MKKAKTIYLSEDTTIDLCDYKGKTDKIIQQLNSEYFDKMEELDTYGIMDEEFKKKKNYVPLSAMKISTRLNEMLRAYRPLSLSDVRELALDTLQSGFIAFMRLISHINKFVVFVPSKQLFSAFIGITTKSYNIIREEPAFMDILDSVEDYLLDQNFVSSQSGLSKENSTITKITARGVGHDVVKTPEVVIQAQIGVGVDPQELMKNALVFSESNKQLKGK